VVDAKPGGSAFEAADRGLRQVGFGGHAPAEGGARHPADEGAEERRNNHYVAMIGSLTSESARALMLALLAEIRVAAVAQLARRLAASQGAAAAATVAPGDHPNR